MKPQTEIRYILVPHDFSEPGEGALDLALDLAKKLGARITILHTYEVVPYAYTENLMDTGRVLREIGQLARHALDAAVRRAAATGVEVTSELRMGPAREQIVAYASDPDAKVDLIVMATHGRRGMARFLIGSVAEGVVRTAPCPVLTFRPPQPASGGPAHHG
ncbi:MAG TPA: universal stress protein [Polyangiaceae bacterium]|jgi:nucleotide-binding universal stress UspA family protein